MARLDESILLWINHWVGIVPSVDMAVKWIVSDYLIPVAMSLALLSLWFTGRTPSSRLKQQLVVFSSLIALAIANWIVFIVNQLYIRDRPFVDHDISLLFYESTDPSFPANSAAVSFAIAASVWPIHKTLGFWMFGAATLFAASRVYAGVHYPSDVIAGAIIGAMAALLAQKIRVALEPLPTWTVKFLRIICLA